jgi:hypothetical protein
MQELTDSLKTGGFQGAPDWNYGYQDGDFIGTPTSRGLFNSAVGGYLIFIYRPDPNIFGRDWVANISRQERFLPYLNRVYHIECAPFHFWIGSLQTKSITIA